MSSFRERIRDLTQENYAREAAEAELQRSKQHPEDDNNARARAENFWQVAIGLGHLVVLLNKSGPNYSGLLKESAQTAPYYQTDLADGYFKELPESKLFKGNHEKYWLFREYTKSHSGREGETITNIGHDFITEAGKVVTSKNGHQPYPFVDINMLHGPQDASRLSLMDPNPSVLVDKIAWTAAHYKIDWPLEAPDLSTIK